MVDNMLITAMYMYGMIQHAWVFSWIYAAICFFIDVIFLRILSPDIRLVHKISDEEKEYLNKRCQVEELKRVKLDRELYGGRRE